MPFFLILPALLIGSAFFSGCETAFFSLKPSDRAALRRRSDAPATAAIKLLREPRMLLITLLLGNMLVNVTYFVVSSVLLLRIDTEGAAGAPVVAIVASLIALLLVIMFGEVCPKQIAARIPVVWVNVAAAPLFAIHEVARPIGALLSRVVILPLIRLLAPSSSPELLDYEEIESLLRISAEEGALSHGERELLSDVVSLGRRKARDVMTPRVAVTFVRVGASLEDVARAVRPSRERWVPVYRRSVDHIIGVLDARRFFMEEPAQVSGRGLIEPTFVPELATLDRALDVIRRAGAKVAIVVDEFGQTAGVITEGDILRALLRIEIESGDAAPEENLIITQLGRWEAPGNLSVRTFEEYFGVRFEEDLRVSTLSGLITERLGHVAEAGDSIVEQSFRLTARDVRGPRVMRIEVEMIE